MLCRGNSSSIWESNGRIQNSHWKQTSAHTLEKSSFLRRASLLWNLDKANYIGSPTLVPYLSLHQFHPYRLLLILFRILCCKIRSPTQFPYRIFFFFFQDCLFAAVFCCISPKNANKGELLTNPLVFAMILLQTDVRIRLPDRVSYRERAVGTQPHLRSLFTISKPIGVDSYIQNQYW